MTILSSIKSALTPTATVQDLDTLKTQIKRVEAEHQSARSHNGQSYQDGDPRTLDHEIIVAEWAVRLCELKERLNVVDPAPAALRSFLITALQTARDGLSELDNAVSGAAPAAPAAIDKSSLRDLSDVFLEQSTLAQRSEQRRSEINARLHCDLLAYFASVQAAGEARAAAKLPGFPGQAGCMYLSALGKAARHGKADVRSIDERIRALGQPEPSGAMYTARVTLRNLQVRHERLEELQAERQRKAAEYDAELSHARSGGWVG